MSCRLPRALGQSAMGSSSGSIKTGSGVGLSSDCSNHQVDPVALVGMACRLPVASGGAEFWSLLREGRDAVGETPADRLGPVDLDTVDVQLGQRPKQPRQPPVATA
jgi:Beta-ketoacyl synthase, N-terminal domain